MPKIIMITVSEKKLLSLAASNKAIWIGSAQNVESRIKSHLSDSSDAAKIKPTNLVYKRSTANKETAENNLLKIKGKNVRNSQMVSNAKAEKGFVYVVISNEL